MTDIKTTIQKASEAGNIALSAADEYVSLFHPDIFGKQKKSESAEDDFFLMADTLKRSAEIFFECASEILMLEEVSAVKSPNTATDLHKKAVLLSEINDLVIAPFLKEIYEEALNPTVDVGKIKNAAYVFSVKIKNYIIKIV